MTVAYNYASAMDPSPQSKGSDAPPDTSALLSSGMVMAEVTQDFIQGQANRADKEKLASAAADMLGASSYYGKLGDKGYGEYVEKAEVYLKQYGGGGGAAPASEVVASEAADAPKIDAGGDGLAGNVVKLAGGLFK